MSLNSLRQEVRKLADKEQAKLLQRFFKTGPGEYAEGDKFLGLKVPDIRRIAKSHQNLALKDTVTLLHSSFHEERLLALIILISQYDRGDDKKKEQIYKLYLRSTRYINNWDLVDLSAKYIVGGFLLNKSKEPLYKLAKSKDLWERRIAILSTFHFIARDQFDDSLRIARVLLIDPHDLIHKAVGWMLREVGKRDLKTEEDFLKVHSRIMPRTMLRYAIERFPERKRLSYLKSGK